MTTQPQPLDTTAIQAALTLLGTAPWRTDGPEIYTDDPDSPHASTWIGETCNVALPDHGRARAEAIVAIHNSLPALIAYTRNLEERTAKADADLTEMTHCRDNAIRALRRDDVDTDIDIEDVIANELAGQGWDWEDDDAPRNVAELLAPAIRPALAKAAEQRDQALARVAELEQQLAKYVGHEPTIAEETAEMNRRLNAVEQLLPGHPGDDNAAPYISPRMLRAALDGDIPSPARDTR